jgi:hypothetical protein
MVIQFGTIYDIFGRDYEKIMDNVANSIVQYHSTSNLNSNMKATQYANTKQWITDTEWKGTIFGVLEVSKLRYKLYELDNGDVVSIPTESREYEFFVRVEGGAKDSIFKIRPSIRDCYAPDLMDECGTRIGCCSELYIETLDSENEIPPHNKLTWVPRSTVKFRLCNMRASIGDNTYRFLINDDEVISLFDDRQEAYMCVDFRTFDNYFTETKYFKDCFTAELQQYKNKIESRYGNAITKYKTIDDAICTGQEVLGNGFVIVGLKIRNPSDKEQASHKILFTNNEIIVDDENPTQLNLTGEMVNREGLLVCGEIMMKKKFLQLLIIGGEIVAQKCLS